MSKKIIWKILSAYILMVLIAVIVLNFFVSLKLRDYYELKISEQLKSNAFLIGDILKGDLLNTDLASIRQKTKKLSKELNLRITIIDPAGKVLADSEKNPQDMDSHSNRLEVIRAQETGFGESNRFSNTLGYSMKYVTFSVEDNNRIEGIIRLALPMTEVESQISVIYRVVLIGGIVAIIIILLSGYVMSRNIVNPITQMKEIAQALAKGDFSKRIKIRTEDELGVLAASLNKMADELQLKIDNLGKMGQMKTDFVANVSHELKTPLTSIKGFIETLEDGAIDDKENAKRFVSIIKKHTDSLSRIIDDLLSLSELELGRDRLGKTEFDLKILIEEITLGFGHALNKKNQDLRQNFIGKDFTIYADKVKIEQIIVNLLDNAIKYTGEKGKIAIDVKEAKEAFLLSVKDNGIGIPDEHLSRIFERFYRVDKARSRQLGGTGLGLAIVKHIVLLHNGEVKIKSQVNKGTEVIISLPKS